MRKSPELIYAEALYETAMKVPAETAVDELIKLLDSNRHIRLLERILIEFKRLCKRREGKFEVKLTFPLEQSAELTAKLVSSLPSFGLFPEELLESAEVNVSIDSSLVGGFIAEAYGKVLDASIKRMLGDKYGA